MNNQLKQVCLDLDTANLTGFIISSMPNQTPLFTITASSLTKTSVMLFALTLLTFIPLLLKLNLPELPHDAYLPLHTALEVIAVVVAALIFAIIREQALVKMTLRGAVIACAFFAVFWLDLAHLLSYKGMPAYFTANEPDKAVNFWLAARLIAASALCFVVLPLADRTTSLTIYYRLLLAAVATVLLFHYWFILQPDTVPLTYIDGVGLTPFKIAVEYLVILINMLTVFLMLYYRRRQTPFHMPALLAAVITMSLSEFYFTLYSHLSDSFNILGHLLKLLSYLFLYRALIYETLAAPYAQLKQSQAELSATLAAVPDILFDVDLDGRFYHVHHQPQSKLYLTPQQFLGKEAQQVLPDKAAKAMQTAIKQAHDRQGCSDAHQYALTIGQETEPSWFQVIAAVKPGYNTAPRFILAVRDVTEQKKAQATERLNALAFYTREAIMITDAQKRIIRVNPAFTEITGFNEAEVIGQHPLNAKLRLARRHILPTDVAYLTAR